MLLRKGVYPYEYVDCWDKFNETSIPSKELFYSNLTMENISETDDIHANNLFKTFKLNNLGDYHDLYVQSDTLLLADVFEKFRKACTYANVCLKLLFDTKFLIFNFLISGKNLK